MPYAPSRIDLFVQRLSEIPVTDRDRIWGLCMQEKRHLKETPWLPAGGSELRRGYAPTSLRSVLRDYRNAIRRALGKNNPALDFLKSSVAEVADYRKRYAMQLVQDHTNQRGIDAEALVDIAEGILRSADVRPAFQIAAALCLVTGRRPWELGCTGSFKRRSAKRLHLDPARGRTLLFDGQAKTKDATSAQTAPYDIPVLVDPAIVLSAFAAMRAKHPFAAIKTGKQFNGYAGKEINEEARRLFKDAERRSLTAKDCRAAYATIAYSWLAPETISENAYFAKILGHAYLDTKSSLSYIDFYLVGEKRAFGQDQRTSIRDGIADLKKLIKRERDPKIRAGYQRNLELLERISKPPTAVSSTVKDSAAVKPRVRRRSSR